MSLSPLAIGIGAGACEEARHLGIGAGCLRTQLIVAAMSSSIHCSFSPELQAEKALAAADAVLKLMALEVAAMREEQEARREATAESAAEYSEARLRTKAPFVAEPFVRCGHGGCHSEAKKSVGFCALHKDERKHVCTEFIRGVYPNEQVCHLCGKPKP